MPLHALHLAPLLPPNYTYENRFERFCPNIISRRNEMELVLTHEPRVRRAISIDKIATEIAPENILIIHISADNLIDPLVANTKSII